MKNLPKIINFCQNITNTLIKKFQKESNLKLLIEYNDVPERIYADEVRLKQILNNLLSNSVKYTNIGFVKLQIINNNDNVKLIIEDTGKGIRDSDKDKLFRPFYELNNDNYNI
jgi:signal transduction histidine kinase